ncbi:cation transporter [Thauera aminoaromatica]|uniref:Heavy-metal-associated domain-containing protein n=1 Tax=Thauera aminoaromatica TaxID=164330 RepID=A0A5C7TB96_THASP|nr:cation transporter [Thauera aminoaromatica]TXH92211.1 MAG: heavy-metal-associated domain-containing protein [Thauera aminoaromatica]
MVSFKELRGFLRDVRIAHHIRGRIRLKLDGRAVSIDVPRVEAGAFQTLLDRTPGVHSVQVNLLARSCTVHYDPEVIPEHAWGDFLAGAASEGASVLERILHDSYREIGNAELR